MKLDDIERQDIRKKVIRAIIDWYLGEDIESKRY